MTGLCADCDCLQIVAVRMCKVNDYTVGIQIVERRPVQEAQRDLAIR